MSKGSFYLEGARVIYIFDNQGVGYYVQELPTYESVEWSSRPEIDVDVDFFDDSREIVVVELSDKVALKMQQQFSLGGGNQYQNNLGGINFQTQMSGGTHYQGTNITFNNGVREPEDKNDYDSGNAIYIPAGCRVVRK